MSIFENKAIIGGGIYTLPDVAEILNIDYSKVRRWVREYWDGKLGESFQRKYSWTVGKNPAIGFHTLVEMYVFIRFSEAGVKTQKLLEAHKMLSEKFATPFPFASEHVVDGIKTDGRQVFFQEKDKTIVTLDASRQVKLDFIKLFFKKLEFTKGVASRLWPMGKSKPVVVDPDHQFGQPTVEGTNILTSTLYNLKQAGEPVAFIASLYELDEKQVKAAISFHKKAA